MGYVKPQDTDLLKLPSDPSYWVRFRKKVLWGVRTDSQGSMVSVAATPKKPVKGQPDAEPEAEMITKAEWSAYIRTLVLGFISEWNLTDENDEPLPITLENLAMLEDEDGQYLASEAQARSKLRSVKADGPLGRRSRRQSSTARK